MPCCSPALPDWWCPSKLTLCLWGLSGTCWSLVSFSPSLRDQILWCRNLTTNCLGILRVGKLAHLRCLLNCGYCKPDWRGNYIGSLLKIQAMHFPCLWPWRSCSLIGHLLMCLSEPHSPRWPDPGSDPGCCISGLESHCRPVFIWRLPSEIPDLQTELARGLDSFLRINVSSSVM